MTEHPFIPVSEPDITNLEVSLAHEAIQSGWISSQGKFITQFEEAFAEFSGAGYGIAVSNGTVALHLSLHALGVGPGDEVIIPDLTFVATANAVLMAGATPVICDVEEGSLCLDPVKVQRLITARTKAVIPVHLYGQPASMEALTRLCKSNGLFLIEDAAEAHGSMTMGRRVGSFGDCATFSFYANKNMTTGEGGMILTSHPDLAMEIRELRDHAMDPRKRYWHDRMGFNYRMTNIQAAIGCAQVQRAEELLGKRAANFAIYKNELASVPGLQLNREIAGDINSYWMICAEFEDYTADQRDKLRDTLLKNNVDSRPYFYPLSSLPFLNAKQPNPVASRRSICGINLPSSTKLSTDDILRVCDEVKRAMTETGKSN